MVRAPAALVLLALGGAARADEDCPQRVEAATLAMARIEADFVQRAYARTVFRSGAPNAEAEKVLRPIIEMMMESTARDRPAFALECRTWACRIRVLHAAWANAARWEGVLRSRELAGRLHAVTVVGRRPTSDAIDGEDLVEATVYFKLIDPSGASLAALSRRRGVPGDDCPTELAKIEKRTAAMQRAMARDLSPAERFAAEPLDTALTADVQARLAQASTGLPASFAGLAATCHGVICQVQPRAALAPADWQRLEARPQLKQVIVGRAYQGAAYWLVRRPGTADGKVIVDGLVAALEAGPAFATCHHQHPKAGHLLVSYVLAGKDPLGRPARKPGLSTVITGSLADTPLGRCLAAELEGALATRTVPADTLNWTRTRRYDWGTTGDQPAARDR
jgi:hypothetical protein